LTWGPRHYYVSENASNIRRIIPLSTHSENEISSLLAEIQKKHENKDEETLLKQKNEFLEVFKEWVANNKEESEKNDDTEFDTITYPDGSKYSGEFKDGIKNGKGIYTYPDGTQYIGEFKDNKFHGQGEITHFSGDNYKGEFMNGDRHGKGTHTYIGGGQYIGEFKNGLQHGEGTNTFNDGGKEVGEYFEGEPWNINGFDEDRNFFYSYVNGKEQE
jgi:hypothetical protein